MKIYKYFLCVLLVCITSLAVFSQDTNWQIRYGKYSCTASKYSNGFYEYIPRGSFTINANDTYTYFGFEKPSKGKFKIDKDGNLLFIGGYLDKGKAEKMDRPDKFYLTFPANPDNRWTSTYQEPKKP